MIDACGQDGGAEAPAAHIGFGGHAANRSPDALSRQTYRTTLGIRHNFTQRIIGSVNFGYNHDTYDKTFAQPSFEEDYFDVSLTLRYVINRTWSAELGYSHSEASAPENLFRDYSRNQYWAGVTFTW